MSDKKGMKVWIIVVVVLSGIILFKDAILTAVVSPIASSILGTKVTVRKVAVKVIASRIIIEDLTVKSPDGFDQKPLLDLEKLDVIYDLGSILRKENHFPYVEINVRQLLLAKKENGDWNVTQLKPLVSKNKESKSETPPQEIPANQNNNTSKPPALTIDELRLNITACELHEGVKGQWQVQRFPLGLNHKVWKDIRSVQDLIGKVMASEASLFLLTNSVFKTGHELTKGVGLMVDTTTGIVKGAGGLLGKFLPKANSSESESMPK